MAGATGLEPATSGVTGRRSNQLSYAPAGIGAHDVIHGPLLSQSSQYKSGKISVIFLWSELRLVDFTCRVFGQFCKKMKDSRIFIR